MEEHKKTVSWTIFSWALGIILILFGIGFNMQVALSNKIDKYVNDNKTIESQLSRIQTDIEWIKLTLDK